MADSEMVERVATAIRTMQTRPGGYTDVEDVARVAIAAMREPTEAMEAAGDDKAEGWMSAAPAGPVWRAMCDAALADPTSSP